jgi:hypothetical protein
MQSSAKVITIGEWSEYRKFIDLLFIFIAC